MLFEDQEQLVCRRSLSHTGAWSRDPHKACGFSPQVDMHAKQHQPPVQHLRADGSDPG